MIKSTVDKVCKGAIENSHVVYVKLYDDKNPNIILTKLCIPFESQSEFEKILEAKKSKYLLSVSDKDEIKALAEQSIINMEKVI